MAVRDIRRCWEEGLWPLPSLFYGSAFYYPRDAVEQFVRTGDWPTGMAYQQQAPRRRRRDAEADEFPADAAGDRPEPAAPPTAGPEAGDVPKRAGRGRPPASGERKPAGKTTATAKPVKPRRSR